MEGLPCWLARYCNLVQEASARSLVGSAFGMLHGWFQKFLTGCTRLTIFHSMEAAAWQMYKAALEAGRRNLPYIIL